MEACVCNWCLCKDSLHHGFLLHPWLHLLVSRRFGREYFANRVRRCNHHYIWYLVYGLWAMAGQCVHTAVGMVSQLTPLANFVQTRWHPAGPSVLAIAPAIPIMPHTDGTIWAVALAGITSAFSCGWKTNYLLTLLGCHLCTYGRFPRGSRHGHLF